MISYQLLTPYSCDPDDVQKTVESQRTSLFFSDVQARGYYPAYANRMFEEKGVELVIEPGDLEVIRENPVDFVSLVTICPVQSAHIQNDWKVLLESDHWWD